VITPAAGSALTRSRPPVWAAAGLLVLVLVDLAQGAPRAAYRGSSPSLSGELEQWHAITLTFDGPMGDEGGGENPFLDYRLTVSFSNGLESVEVPGYFAADGRAGETGATRGRAWRAHFVPDTPGVWRYTAFFHKGAEIAVSPDPAAGEPTAFDGVTGSFSIAPTHETGRDSRGKGMLRYVGERYLRFAGTGEAFLKGGADSPENLLAFADFDATPERHHYAPHVADWRPGDPTWRGGRGKGLIGALNYLASRGMNSVYFLTMNVGGDGKDVWPWTGPDERRRFDVSKLDQWEVVFAHMDRIGLLLHVVQQETENDHLLDGGELGVDRKLYYRELVARFGHHLALVWNLGEENTNTQAQRVAFATYLRALDPYDHPIVVHTLYTRKERSRTLTPLLGLGVLEGPSLQMGDVRETHDETLHWVESSRAARRPWFVCLDEIGPADRGVLPDADDPTHDDPRRYGLWGNLMAGGSGAEWYLGSTEFLSSDGVRARRWWDLETEDWRAHEAMWDQTRYALEFFQRYIPFPDMEPSDLLAQRPDAECLAREGEVYVVYLPTGGGTALDLGAHGGSFDVRWYDPRNGGELQAGSLESVSGPGIQDLGKPPSEPGRDWVVLVRSRKERRAQGEKQAVPPGTS
jgi:Domain of unknown function (DUF5060)/Putative collagen-binding domain of a collagenase